MGFYFNPPADGFAEILRDGFYVDKMLFEGRGEVETSKDREVHDKYMGKFPAVSVSLKRAETEQEDQ